MPFNHYEEPTVSRQGNKQYKMYDGNWCICILYTSFINQNNWHIKQLEQSNSSLEVGIFIDQNMERRFLSQENDFLGCADILYHPLFLVVNIEMYICAKYWVFVNKIFDRLECNVHAIDTCLPKQRYFPHLMAVKHWEFLQSVIS